MFNSPFSSEQHSNTISIPDDIDIVFVSDLFSNDHIGGAELTTDALIESSPYSVFRLYAKDVTPEIISDNSSVFNSISDSIPSMVSVSDISFKDISV